MESVEKLRPKEHELLTSFNGKHTGPSESITRNMQMTHREVVARGLLELWHELNLDAEPLIFNECIREQMDIEHPILLDQLIASGGKRKRTRCGQLIHWRYLNVPQSAHGVSIVHETVYLLKADMLRVAELGDRGTIPSSSYGWFCYTFASGWTALSVHFYDPERGEATTMVAFPAGRQDEWLAFLELLAGLRNKIARRERRGHIEIIGGDDKLVHVIKQTSFNDVVLSEPTLAQVSAQRRIFDPKVLQRYATLRVPRLRKVLLVGPPGTGKTTLLKAEGALHAKHGGLVFYVCAPGDVSSWQQLSYALASAAESRLPTLVLVEDFEMFVANPHELQMVLNTLDGVATPDNPAGTLLLATSNDPEKIDPRIRDRPGRVDMLIEIGLVEDLDLAVRFLRHFLGTAYLEDEHASLASLLLRQPGSHFREVCIAGAMHALEMDRTDVIREDLIWAHEAILGGRLIASQGERFLPASARKQGGFFRKNQ